MGCSETVVIHLAQVTVQSTGLQRVRHDWATSPKKKKKTNPKITIKYFKGKYRTDHLKGKET